MSQALFAAATAPSLVSLDANFSECYAAVPLTAILTAAGGNLLLSTATNVSPVCRMSIGYAGAGTIYGLSFRPAADITTHIAFLNAAGSQVGSITETSTTTAYNTTSDHRLKFDQQPLGGSGKFIDALLPKRWKWENGEVAAGFIAHEFQTVCPSAVHGEKDAVDADGAPVYQAMQASAPEVIGNIVAELQSVRARLSALEAR